MISRLAATNGCKHINSADGATTGDFFAFIPDQDTVVSAITVKTNAGNNSSEVTTTHTLTTLGLSGKTLHIGSYICVPSDSRITSITLSSGAVVAYNNAR